jgi:hypothetical protein
MAIRTTSSQCLLSRGWCCSEFAFGEANTSAVSISRYGGAPVIFTAEEAVGLKSEAPRTREWRGFAAAIKNNESLVFCRSSARVERQTDTERLMSRRAKGASRAAAKTPIRSPRRRARATMRVTAAFCVRSSKGAPSSLLMRPSVGHCPNTFIARVILIAVPW